MPNSGSFSPKVLIVAKFLLQIFNRSDRIYNFVTFFDAIQIAQVHDVAGDTGRLFIFQKLDLNFIRLWRKIITRVFVDNQILVLRPKVVISTLGFNTPANNPNPHLFIITYPLAWKGRPFSPLPFKRAKTVLTTRKERAVT